MSVKSDRQWICTATNKIRRIFKSKSDKSVAEKYRVNPKWRMGLKNPLQKGSIIKRRKTYEKDQ